MLPILKKNSIHMRRKRGHNMWNWLLMFVQCVGYNVNHIDIVEEFDQPYYDIILWIGFSCDPYH